MDEICEALDGLGDAVKSAYLRIGSRYSTGQQFENQLLAKKIEEVTTRKGLKDVLEHHRIFVATLASLSNNLELLQLKKFRQLAVDEASRKYWSRGWSGCCRNSSSGCSSATISNCPPWWCSRPKLPPFWMKNFMKSACKTCIIPSSRAALPTLRGAGLALGHQAPEPPRADAPGYHALPGEHFYEGKLRILLRRKYLLQKQLAPLAAQVSDNQGDWLAKIEGRRIAFLDTPADRQSPSRKTNRFEAELLAQMITPYSNWQLAVGSWQSGRRQYWNNNSI